MHRLFSLPSASLDRALLRPPLKFIDRRGDQGVDSIGLVKSSARVEMVSYIPVLTTTFSLFFLGRHVPHCLSKGSPYLLWWTLGVLTFGLGTLTESINAIFGWSEWNTKVWYIVGALLGGYPLAQGTIYLLMNKRFADISAVVCSVGIVLAAVCVLASPIELPASFDQRLTGSVLQLNWAMKWVRFGFAPLLNTYALIFLGAG